MEGSIRKQILCAVFVLPLASCEAQVLPPGLDTDPVAFASTPPTPPPAALLSSASDPTIAPASASGSPAPPAASAASVGSGPTIAPGQTRIFTVADGGETACSSLLDIPILLLPPPPSSEDECMASRYGIVFNTNQPSTNKVTVFAQGLEGQTSALIPAHASSAVYNDFTVAGPLDSLVDAQIAVTFDFVGTIAGLSVYRDELSLSLVVEDLTNAQPVGALSLVTQGRDGDQGVTDVTGTAEGVPVDDASGGLIVKVRRGHTYRVWFQLEVDNFGLGYARGAAQWSTLVVSIDEDCETVSQQRKNQGCNGLDDDCDGLVDECDEDVFGPTVFVDPAIRGQCFPAEADALAAILEATEASDDCGPVTVTPGVSGSECDVEGSVSVADDCGNVTTVTGLAMRIDGEAPVVTCSTAVTVLSPPNGSFTDVGFEFSASDNCGGELNIDVKVTSDEQTTLPPGSGHASSFPDAVVLRTIDGEIAGVFLRNDRGGGGDGRVYNIHVFATDRCGNVGHAACAVSVPADGSNQAVDSGQYFDATGIN